MNIFNRIANWWRDLWTEDDDEDGYPGDTCLFCGGDGEIVVNGQNEQRLMNCPVCRGTGKVQ